ncbi:MAG: DUF5317 domain-containing protein [Actinomycetota bacterium]
MRLYLIVLALAVVLGYLFGGRLTNLEQLHLRWWWLALAGLGIQFLPLPEGGGGSDLIARTGVLALSYALLLTFGVLNVRLPGMPVILLGVACNAAVIVSNGGMPVSEDALRASGQADVIRYLVDEGAYKHHLMEDFDVLKFLADVIPVAGPIHQVISIGDVFIYAGLVWLVVWAMRVPSPSRSPRASRRNQGKHRRGSAAGAGAAARAIPSPPPPPRPPAARTWGSEP